MGWKRGKEKWRDRGRKILSKKGKRGITRGFVKSRRRSGRQECEEEGVR
jgi:hypothetical protein